MTPTKDGVFSDLSPQRPYVAIHHPTGDLSVFCLLGSGGFDKLGTEVCGWPIFRMFGTGPVPAECVSGCAHLGQ